MPQFPISIRRLALIGGAVLVLGGAAVGIAAAQTAPTTSPSGQQQSGYQAFVAALARHLNISTQTLETAITQARQESGFPANGHGFPGRGGPRGGMRVELNAAATAIGISPEQLRQELPGKSLAQVAEAHGKSANDVATALKNAAHQRIDTAVSNGRLTADQANTQKTRADQRIDQLVNQVLPQGGPGGKGEGFGRGFGGRGPFGAGLDAAANAIGISQQQLRQELPGKSLAQVAEAHGKSANDVATALKNAAHQRLETAVSNGRLTADQANTMKARLDEGIDQFVNHVMPQRPAGGPGAEDEGESE